MRKSIKTKNGVNMKNIITFLALVVLIFSLDAQELSEPQFSIENYQTFAFVGFEEYLKENPDARTNAERIETAIIRELKLKGILISDKPELILNIAISVEEKVQTRETTIHDMHYMGQRNYHWEVEEVPVGTYREGTLLIDFIDASANKLVHQLEITEVLTKNDKKMEKRINKQISKSFSRLK